MNKKNQINSEFKKILEFLGNDLPNVKSILKKNSFVSLNLKLSDLG